MIQARREICLGFSAETVREGQHICYIYNDEAERRRVMEKNPYYVQPSEFLKGYRRRKVNHA